MSGAPGAQPAAPAAARSTWDDVRALPPTAWALFGGTFVNRFGQFVLVFLVLYLTRKGYSVTQAGAALSIYGIGSLAAAVVGGPLADHVGRRGAIALSMFSSAATMLALSQANTLAFILPLTGLAGFTAELYRPASAALVADLTPAGGRVTAFALYRLAVNAGVAIGPAVAGYLADRRMVLLFIGDAATSAAFGCMALIALPVGLSATRGSPRATGALRRMRGDRSLLALLASCVIIAFVFNQAYVTVPLHVASLGLSSANYGALMSLNGFMIITLELAITSVTRRHPPRAVLATGVLLTGVGFAATGLAHTFSSLVACVVVWTFGEMVFSPVASAYVADLAPPEMRGRYQAAFGFAFSAGLVLAPLLGAALFARSAALHWSTCLLLGIVAAMVITLVPRGE